MTTFPSPDAWAASLDAARPVLAEAGHRLSIAVVLADELGARTRWSSPAATAFREGLAAWRDDLCACRHELEGIADSLRLARTRLLAEAGG